MGEPVVILAIGSISTATLLSIWAVVKGAAIDAAIEREELFVTGRTIGAPAVTSRKGETNDSIDHKDDNTASKTR